MRFFVPAVFPSLVAGIDMGLDPREHGQAAHQASSSVIEQDGLFPMDEENMMQIASVHPTYHFEEQVRGNAAKEAQMRAGIQQEMFPSYGTPEMPRSFPRSVYSTPEMGPRQARNDDKMEDVFKLSPAAYYGDNDGEGMDYSPTPRSLTPRNLDLTGFSISTGEGGSSKEPETPPIFARRFPAVKTGRSDSTDLMLEDYPFPKRTKYSGNDRKNWQPNHASSTCTKCKSAFGILNRRTHCRQCGYLFCKTCCYKQKHPLTRKENKFCTTCMEEAEKKVGNIDLAPDVDVVPESDSEDRQNIRLRQMSFDSDSLYGASLQSDTTTDDDEISGAAGGLGGFGPGYATPGREEFSTFDGRTTWNAFKVRARRLLEYASSIRSDVAPYYSDADQAALNKRFDELGDEFREILPDLVRDDKSHFLMQLIRGARYVKIGMIKFKIAVYNKFSLTFHIFDKRLEQSVEGLHNHQWDFRSTILFGKLTHEIWETCSPRTGWDDLKSLVGFRKTKIERPKTQRISSDAGKETVLVEEEVPLKFKEKVEYTAGQTYFCPTDVIHKVLSPETPTATLILTHPPTAADEMFSYDPIGADADDHESYQNPTLTDAQIRLVKDLLSHQYKDDSTAPRTTPDQALVLYQTSVQQWKYIADGLITDDPDEEDLRSVFQLQKHVHELQEGDINIKPESLDVILHYLRDYYTSLEDGSVLGEHCLKLILGHTLAEAAEYYQTHLGRECDGDKGMQFLQQLKKQDPELFSSLSSRRASPRRELKHRNHVPRVQ